MDESVKPVIEAVRAFLDLLDSHETLFRAGVGSRAKRASAVRLSRARADLDEAMTKAGLR